MNTSQHEKIGLDFILRRAFRHRQVSRADLCRVLDISENTASRIITRAQNKFSHLLHRKGHPLTPFPSAKCPALASEEDLLKNLDEGKHHPSITGFFKKELRVKNGKVKIASRSLHDFKRRFTNAAVSENAVWPPLILKDN